MTHDVAVQVRGYLMVFGALLVLTLVTVGVSYLDLPEVETVVVGAHHRDGESVAGGDVLHAPEGRAADGVRGRSRSRRSSSSRCWARCC